MSTWEGPTLAAGKRSLSNAVTPVERGGALPPSSSDEELSSGDEQLPPAPPPRSAPPPEDDGPVFRGAAAGLLLSFLAAALLPTLLPGVAARTVLLAALGSGVVLVLSFLAVAPLFRSMPLWVVVFLVCACVGGLVGGVVGDAVSALPAMQALQRALPWRK